MDIVTPEFLTELQSMLEKLSRSHSIYSRYVLDVLDKFPDTSDEDPRLLVRKIRDDIFKSGFILKSTMLLCLCGQYASFPESSLPHLYDSDSTRSKELGQAYSDSTYGDTASKTQYIYPDLDISWIWIPVEQFWIRLWYSFMGVTSAKKTSFAMIPALIPNDTPRQVEWVERCIRDCVPACGESRQLGAHMMPWDPSKGWSRVQYLRTRITVVNQVSARTPNC
ncbi:hypothetical protein EV424DRAFT_1558229, partial [Suillus variegatus]